MEDRYLNSKEIVNSLIQKWQKHQNLIVAFDFDDTIKAWDPIDICKIPYKLILRCQKLGFTTILFTCREDERLKWAMEYLRKIGIQPTYINNNPLVSYIGGRKPYYNILLDDKAGLGQACECLDEVLTYIETSKQ